MWNENESFIRNMHSLIYSKTCVREPPSRLTLNSGWCGKKCLSYKGTCHVILLAKLHDMYLYKTTTFPHQPLRSILKVAVLHRVYCMWKKYKTQKLNKMHVFINICEMEKKTLGYMYPWIHMWNRTENSIFVVVSISDNQGLWVSFFDL